MPEPSTSSLNPQASSLALATDVVRRLREAGHQAYFVGGCVRDLLLGLPAQDYDVATDALPEQVVALFPGSLEVGARFGVVVVEGVEVATFRNDGLYTDGRHPEAVSYTRDPSEDVRRRDFTINGLLYDPLDVGAGSHARPAGSHPRPGRTLDFVGGVADLRAGVIRAIGDPLRRFEEDKLRLLRAVRFAARFGYRIEESTFQAIRLAVGERAGLSQVSRERLRDELTKILTEGRARRGFELLDETGLLEEVLPEVAAMKGVAQPPQFHPEGDVWIHTLLLLEGLDRPTATLAWGALLHDVGKPPTFRPPEKKGERIRFDNHTVVGARMVEQIAERLRFSRRDTERIAALAEHHLRFKDVRQMRPATLKRFLRMEGFEELLELHRLDCLASHGDLSAYEFVREKMEELSVEEIRPPALLNGHDLIAMGYTPGPAFKEILRAVEDAQLEGRFGSKEEARAFVRERFAM